MEGVSGMLETLLGGLKLLLGGPHLWLDALSPFPLHFLPCGICLIQFLFFASRLPLGFLLGVPRPLYHLRRRSLGFFLSSSRHVDLHLCLPVRFLFYGFNGRICTNRARSEDINQFTNHASNDQQTTRNRRNCTSHCVLYVKAEICFY